MDTPIEWGRGEPSPYRYGELSPYPCPQEAGRVRGGVGASVT